MNNYAKFNNGNSDYLNYIKRSNMFLNQMNRAQNNQQGASSTYIIPYKKHPNTNLNYFQYKSSSPSRSPSLIRKKKTLVLDLDETLVHSSFTPPPRQPDISFSVNFDGINRMIYVLKRPHVEEFLNILSNIYEIIIFTASISQYADFVINKIDTYHVVKNRLFRQHCIFDKGLFIKDLTKLGRDLKDVIIIDNNPVSYALNQDNGIPIPTWYENLQDNELMKLIPILKYLSKIDDVRPIIKQIANRGNDKIDFNVVNQILNGGQNNIKLYNNNYVNNYVNTNTFIWSNGKIENNVNSNEYQNMLNYVDKYYQQHGIKITDSLSNMTLNDIKKYNNGISYENSSNNNFILPKNNLNQGNLNSNYRGSYGSYPANFIQNNEQYNNKELNTNVSNYATNNPQNIYKINSNNFIYYSNGNRENNINNINSNNIKIIYTNNNKYSNENKYLGVQEQLYNQNYNQNNLRTRTPDFFSAKQKVYKNDDVINLKEENRSKFTTNHGENSSNNIKLLNNYLTSNNEAVENNHRYLVNTKRNNAFKVTKITPNNIIPEKLNYEDIFLKRSSVNTNSSYLFRNKNNYIKEDNLKNYEKNPYNNNHPTIGIIKPTLTRNFSDSNLHKNNMNTNITLNAFSSLLNKDSNTNKNLNNYFVDNIKNRNNASLDNKYNYGYGYDNNINLYERENNFMKNKDQNDLLKSSGFYPKINLDYIYD